MSRLAITIFLATCALAIGAGDALAVSALSTSSDAGSLQYGSGQKPDFDSKAAENAGDTPGQKNVAAQAPRQLAAGKLAFTGYSAILVVFIGLVLLAAGLSLRRRTPFGPTRGS